MADLPLPDALAGDDPRTRLLVGLAEGIREQGFRGTTVAEIVARARTSRRTFYEHFTDRDAALIALFEIVNVASIEHIVGGVDATASWTTQVDQALDAYVATLALEPQLTVCFVRELPALGAEAVAMQAAVTEQFADLIVRLLDTDAMRTAGVAPISRLTALLLVGGLRELTVHAVEHGEDLASIVPVAQDVLKAVLDPARTHWT